MNDDRFNQGDVKAKKNPGDDVRCCCGRLLAKQAEAGIVIKCARCKREVIIDISNMYTQAQFDHTKDSYHSFSLKRSVFMFYKSH